jgi:hypothetical protein
MGDRGISTITTSKQLVDPIDAKCCLQWRPQTGPYQTPTEAPLDPMGDSVPQSQLAVIAPAFQMPKYAIGCTIDYVAKFLETEKDVQQ